MGSLNTGVPLSLFLSRNLKENYLTLLYMSSNVNSSFWSTNDLNSSLMPCTTVYKERCCVFLAPPTHHLLNVTVTTDNYLQAAVRYLIQRVPLGFLYCQWWECWTGLSLSFPQKDIWDNWPGVPLERVFTSLKWPQRGCWEAFQIMHLLFRWWQQVLRLSVTGSVLPGEWNNCHEFSGQEFTAPSEFFIQGMWKI